MFSLQFEFKGSVSSIGGDYITDIDISTIAPSAKKAVLNVEYRAKKRLGLVATSKIYLDGQLKVMYATTSEILNIHRNKIDLSSIYDEVLDQYTYLESFGKYHLKKGSLFIPKELSDRLGNFYFSREQFIEVYTSIQDESNSDPFDYKPISEVDIDGMKFTRVGQDLEDDEGNIWSYDADDEVYWLKGVKYGKCVSL